MRLATKPSTLNANDANATVSCLGQQVPNAKRVVRDSGPLATIELTNVTGKSLTFEYTLAVYDHDPGELSAGMAVHLSAPSAPVWTSNGIREVASREQMPAAWPFTVSGHPAADGRYWLLALVRVDPEGIPSIASTCTVDLASQ